MSAGERIAMRWGALALVVAAIACLHAFAIGNDAIADDTYFAAALQQRSLGDYLAFRYQQWSGRLAIEALLVLVVGHVALWKVLNAAVLLWFCHSAGRIAFAGERTTPAVATALALCLFLSMPPDVLFEAAWWRTGSINYLWPTAAGLYGLLAFVDRERNTPWRRLACLLASGFAMHNEQLAFVLLPATAWLLWREARGGACTRWDVAHGAFMAANAALVFLAPGSQRRFIAETGLRFPDFGALDAFDKAAIGLELLHGGTVGPTNLLFAIAAALAIAFVVRSPAGRIAKTVLVVALAFVVAMPVLVALFPSMQAAMQAYYDPPATGGLHASSSRIYAMHAWLAFMAASLVVACALAFRASRERMLAAAGVLALGFGTMFALGFSPTAYASGVRTLFVGQAAMLLVVMCMWRRLDAGFGRRAQLAVLAAIIAVAFYRFLGLVGWT